MAKLTKVVTGKTGKTSSYHRTSTSAKWVKTGGSTKSPKIKSIKR